MLRVFCRVNRGQPLCDHRKVGFRLFHGDSLLQVSQHPPVLLKRPRNHFSCRRPAWLRRNPQVRIPHPNRGGIIPISVLCTPLRTNVLFTIPGSAPKLFTHVLYRSTNTGGAPGSYSAGCITRPYSAGMPKNSNVPGVTKFPSNRCVPSPDRYSTSVWSFAIARSNT